MNSNAIDIMQPNTLSTRQERQDILESSLQTMLHSSKSRHEFVKRTWSTRLPLEDVEPPNSEVSFAFIKNNAQLHFVKLTTKQSHIAIREKGQRLSRPRTVSEQAQEVPPESDSYDKYWMLFAARVMTIVDAGCLRYGIIPG